MTTPGWEDVLPSPPRGGRLHEAWMTSFEQPDATLLVEHLLPSLLRVRCALSREFQDRTLFFGELSTTLEALRSRLTVISSPPRGARGDSQYPWLWRYVSHFTVGSEVRAVQHAKLWAFHWKFDHGEALELRVSSTNLTSSAFRSQLQAGWRVMLPLGDKTFNSTLQTWGDLVPFLNALGTSAGSIAASRLQRLIGLLRRAKCPEGVTFVASVPGRTGATRPLAEFKPSEIHVLTPTIGEWSAGTLAAWSADVGVSPKNVHLKWISTDHPWAAGSGWALSTTAIKNLQSSGVKLECIPRDARFSEQQRDGDLRWSHAKLYLLRNRQKRRLLITSANWSASAWGSGKIKPRNFELGVLFEAKWTDLEALDETFAPPKSVPYCVDGSVEEDLFSTLEWAEASWDGKCILLRARSTDSTVPICAVVAFGGNTEKRIPLVNCQAVLLWNDMELTPLTVRFAQGGDELEVEVSDLRPANEFAKTPLPEVDPGVEKSMREAFLLQRYGGPAVEPEVIPGLGGERRPSGPTASAADYAVHAWVEARSAFAVVDSWRAAMDEAAADELRREQVRLDGEELSALFARCVGPGASLVVEELGWRLNEEA